MCAVGLGGVRAPRPIKAACTKRDPDMNPCPRGCVGRGGGTRDGEASAPHWRRRAQSSWPRLRGSHPQRFLKNLRARPLPLVCASP